MYARAEKDAQMLTVPPRGTLFERAESTLSFHSLPSLQPIPPQTLPHFKGVSTVVLDDAEVAEGGADGEGLVSLCVVKRKQILLVKVAQSRWGVIKVSPAAICGSRRLFKQARMLGMDDTKMCRHSVCSGIDEGSYMEWRGLSKHEKLNAFPFARLQPELRRCLCLAARRWLGGMGTLCASRQHQHTASSISAMRP